MTLAERRGRNWRLWSLGHRVDNRLYLFRWAWKDAAGLSDGAKPLHYVSAAVVWEPRDLWVGCYWTRVGFGAVMVYLCLVPCLPLRLHFKRAWGTGGVA